MAIEITSPYPGQIFLTTQSISLEFEGGTPVSYQITPGGSVVNIPSGQATSPINIGAISTAGNYTIHLNGASSGDGATVAIEVVTGPPPPGGGGDSP